MAITERAARALDNRLRPLEVDLLRRPPRGWLRAVRDALGMTTRQYAARLGIVQSGAVRLEKSEVDETITLGSLRRAAEALDCRLVYAVVPNRPLTERLRQQAELKADEQLQHVSHTMRLENQGLTTADEKRQRELLIDQLLRGNLRRLWDEPA